MSKQSMEGMGEKNWPIKKLLIKISIKIEIKKARIQKEKKGFLSHIEKAEGLKCEPDGQCEEG